jgi:protein MAK16
MASDDMVWSIIGAGTGGTFCSEKIKTSKDQTFCKHPQNVTGFCSRQACPLANSRYATIRAGDDGELYLWIKEAERSHLPSKWWEKIKLPSNYTRALALVDQHLQYFPKFLLHKNKQRLTRLTQVNIRIRKLAKEDERLGERLVPRLAPKVRRREEGRERKALAAAKVERAIERVLVERLRSGAYGDKPLNVEANVWAKVLKGLEKEGAKGDEDLDEGVSEDEEENEYERELEDGVVEYVSDIEGESDDDLEDFQDWMGGQSADEDDDEDDEDEDEGSDSGASDQASEEDGTSDDEEVTALKKSLANLKRKRPTGPPPKSKKKPTKDGKGPRREIEYEVEREPAVRQTIRS